MGFGNLLKTVRKLNRMGRWATEYMTEDIRPTIASHSFTVTQAAQMLAVIEEHHGTVINWKTLYGGANNHDVKESLTGDVLSHVKNHDKGIKQSILGIENILMEKDIYSKLPKEYADAFRTLYDLEKDDTVEGQILSAADDIDCIIECILEVTRNNPEEVFFRTYVSKIKKLQKMNLFSVKYFLENTLYELVGNNAELKRVTKEVLREGK
jgi:putative hydrolase of HD superfamily